MSNTRFFWYLIYIGETFLKAAYYRIKEFFTGIDETDPRNKTL